MHIIYDPRPPVGPYYAMAGGVWPITYGSSAVVPSCPEWTVDTKASGSWADDSKSTGTWANDTKSTGTWEDSTECC